MDLHVLIGESVPHMMNATTPLSTAKNVDTESSKSTNIEKTVAIWETQDFKHLPPLE